MRAITTFLCAVAALFLAEPAWSQPVPQEFATPEAALATYLGALEQGDSDQVTECYTASSRRMVAEHPELSKGRAPEELKASFALLEPLTFRTEMVNEKRAILHPDDDQVPPLFLRRQVEAEGWRIDLHFMVNYIRPRGDGWSYTFPKAEQIWRSRK